MALLQVSFFDNDRTQFQILKAINPYKAEVLVYQIKNCVADLGLRWGGGAKFVFGQSHQWSKALIFTFMIFLKQLNTNPS